MNKQEIQEIFNELDEDARRLYYLVHMIKLDLILKNNERAKDRLEKSSFLADKIGSNLFRLLNMIEKEPNRLGDEV